MNQSARSYRINGSSLEGCGHIRSNHWDTYDLLLFALLRPHGLGPLGADVGFGPGLADDPGGGGVGEVQLELGQVQVVHPVLLAGHSCAGTIDQDAVLVNHVHDDHEFSLQWANGGLGHTACLNESLERLQGERIRLTTNAQQQQRGPHGQGFRNSQIPGQLHSLQPILHLRCVR